MQLLERMRPWALFSAALVLVCLLSSWPFAETGICDDFSYVWTAHTLADTGHLVYVGWAAAMLGWQVYVAAALFKVFGFSFTVARLTTWLVAAATTFLLQRLLVRHGVAERNATIAALCFALSPVFFMLSASFMTDVEGVFAIVVCLYCCTRALQTQTSRATAVWIVGAVATNAVLGTSRQVAWLGVFVVVPSTLWLLRERRRVVFVGVFAILVAAFFILICLLWFQRQPYTMGETVAAGVPLTLAAMLAHVFRQVVASLLELPLLLLPLTAIFLPEVRQGSRRTLCLAGVLAIVYVAMAFHWRHSHPDYLLEPTTGNWLGVYGYIEAQGPRGSGPVLLHLPIRALLTFASLGGALGFVLRRRQPPRALPSTQPAVQLSLGQAIVLLLPYTVVYSLLLIPRGVSELFDRYLIGLLLLPVTMLARVYQERVRQQLPAACIVLLGLMAAYSVCCVHNSFAQARAEIALDHRLQAAGVPEDHVDFGWSYDSELELQHFGHIDNPSIRNPPNAYVPVPLSVDPECYKPPLPLRYLTPVYGVSFDPNLCLGRAPLPSVSYVTWPIGQRTELYVVKYTPLHSTVGTR